MAKMNKTVSFKNAEFKISNDELNGGKRIVRLETLKDEDVYTEFDDILEMFAGETGLTISIKVESGLE